MTIFNLGSINIDKVYRLPHLPGPGETLASTDTREGLGGKGANMSIAMARAAARVVHIGGMGADGTWTRDYMLEHGVDTRHIIECGRTGHAIIMVDDQGENSILLYPGANRCIPISAVIAALSEADSSDIFVTQNETNLQADAARMAAAKGLRVAYAAAPFEAEAVQALLPYLDLLFLNEVEAQQLTEATGLSPDALPVKDVIVTLGSKGSRWIDTRSGTTQEFPAHKVTPIDTTGAGDTFTGYVLAGLDRGLPMDQAIRQATRAAALMVTRLGTADVIPDLREVKDFQP